MDQFWGARSRDTGYDTRTVNKALRELCDMGIIDRSETAGRGYTYTLNCGSVHKNTPLTGRGRSDATPLTTPPSPSVPGTQDAPPTPDAPPPPSFSAGDPPHSVQTHHTKEPKENHQGTQKSKRARARKTQPDKSAYGEFANVLLTPEEHEKLCSRYSPEKTAKAITFLDLHIADKGYKSKSHYHAMLKWVFDAVEEREAKQARASPGGGYKSPAQKRLEANQDAVQAFVTGNY